MINVSLFAEQERETKLDKIGDGLSKLAEHVDFAALAAEIDEAAPRAGRERGGRPPFPTELLVRVPRRRLRRTARRMPSTRKSRSASRPYLPHCAAPGDRCHATSCGQVHRWSTSGANSRSIAPGALCHWGCEPIVFRPVTPGVAGSRPVHSARMPSEIKRLQKTLKKKPDCMNRAFFRLIQRFVENRWSSTCHRVTSHHRPHDRRGEG